jgi:hypothetical protein
LPLLNIAALSLRIYLMQITFFLQKDINIF